MLAAGKLKTKLALERKAKTKNSFNETVETWLPLTTLWSRIISTQTSGVEIGGALMKVTRLSIGLRYRADLLFNDTLVYQGKRYDIVEIDNVLGANVELILGLEHYES